ncbi:MAG TPA: hypothetical protein PKY82_25465 [Pyrinomonadaceae bacterium]|nr:hypothetical protein [Pyrinomonadaceae bacterium]
MDSKEKTTRNNSETGNAKNVENFQKLISFITALGTRYNPTNPALLITALEAKFEESTAVLSNVKDAFSANKLAISDREAAFSNLRKLITRTKNYYGSSGTSQGNLEDARSFTQKIQGSRAKPAPQAEGDSTEMVVSYTASQQSYLQLIEHFNGLIEIYAKDPFYNPNEEDLKLTTLRNYAADLKAKNTAVIETYTTLSNARIARNKSLYDEQTGLVAISKLVKRYVNGVIGTNAAEFKQISSINFTTV